MAYLIPDKNIYDSLSDDTEIQYFQDKYCSLIKTIPSDKLDRIFIK